MTRNRIPRLAQLSGDFSRVFVVSGVLGLLALALVSRWPKTAASSSTGGVWQRLREGEGIVAVASDKAVLVTSLAQAGQFFINGTLNAFLPLYARDVLHFSPSWIGWLFGLQIAAALAARPVFGFLSDRLGRRPLIVAGLVTSASCMFAISWMAGFGSLALVTMIYGVGVALTTSATSAYITDLTRRAQYGAAHGLFGTIYDIGDALGPICGGLVAASAGYGAAFQVAGTIAATIAIVFGYASRGWQRAAVPVSTLESRSYCKNSANERPRVSLGSGAGRRGPRERASRG